MGHIKKPSILNSGNCIVIIANNPEELASMLDALRTESDLRKINPGVISSVSKLPSIEELIAEGLAVEQHKNTVVKVTAKEGEHIIERHFSEKDIYEILYFLKEESMTIMGPRTFDEVIRTLAESIDIAGLKQIKIGDMKLTQVLILAVLFQIFSGNDTVLKTKVVRLKRELFRQDQLKGYTIFEEVKVWKARLESFIKPG